MPNGFARNAKQKIVNHVTVGCTEARFGSAKHVVPNIWIGVSGGGY